uniref:Uncharacterized protein n=1 Tax=Caenorhabditis japonica TaxID=281687 RepID=A0A8R1EP25_CAEJA
MDKLDVTQYKAIVIAQQDVMAADANSLVLLVSTVGTALNPAFVRTELIAINLMDTVYALQDIMVKSVRKGALVQHMARHAVRNVTALDDTVLYASTVVKLEGMVNLAFINANASTEQRVTQKHTHNVASRGDLPENWEWKKKRR